MTRLANGFNDGKFTSKSQRDDCYRAVIDGATAIEVAFPPVFIDSGMYGDGGVRQQVFLASPKNALAGHGHEQGHLAHDYADPRRYGVQDDTPGVDGAAGSRTMCCTSPSVPPASSLTRC